MLVQAITIPNIRRQVGVVQPGHYLQGSVRYYELNITLQSINPDCSDHTSPVILANNQMPGPPITANKGDWIRVLVRNQLAYPASLTNANISYPHDVTIHFHGIRQYNSVHADGVPFLTQMPIQPGEEFLYEFRAINQAGTFFYHAHVGLEQETLFGPLIIYESELAHPENLKPEQEYLASNTTKLIAGTHQYDHERTIMLSEWWHRPRLEFEDFLLSPQFDHLPEPDSILINGHTLYNNLKLTVDKCEGYEVVPVEANKTYRLRLIGATSFRTLGFAIAGHNLTIIEVDGEMTKPHTVEYVEISPGQRFSVLIHTNQSMGDYTIETVRRWSDTVPRNTNGYAALRYTDMAREIKDPQLTSSVLLHLPVNRPIWREKLDEEKPYWIWGDLEPLFGVDPIVYMEASRVIKLRSVEEVLADNTTRWFVNGLSYSEMGSSQRPILEDILNGNRRAPAPLGTYPTGYDPQLGTYPIGHYEVIDFVIQSTYKPGDTCRSHPWHTHGHSHWEIAHGPGEYEESRDGDIRNVKSPLYKDLTMVYPYIDPTLKSVNNAAIGCGWSKIRIIADNPGIWAMHCHNTPHMLMGMMIALEESPELITSTISTF
ncbi:Cupredoxin [Pilobolus umbonatus]|nr:Cupredoxin [Pilobolus umbonatus]